MIFKTIVAVVVIVCATDAALKQGQAYTGYSSGYAQKGESHQDLSKVPGTPGVDYPIYHSVPETSFNCKDVPYAPGMYANVETGCQAYHTCHDGREGHQGASFLCANGTLFNQKEFACDWWYNVDCSKATYYYEYHKPLWLQLKRRLTFLYIASGVNVSQSFYSALMMKLLSNSGPRVCNAYVSLNTDPAKNPFTPKIKATEEPYYKQPSYDNYYQTPKYY